MGLDGFSENNHDSILVYDTETEVKGNRPNGEKDILKIMGYFSYKDNEYKVLPYTKNKEIREKINEHKFLVGFNNERYDNPVLKTAKINTSYKRIIDLYKIIKNRANSMITNKGMLGDELISFSLDFITRFLDLADNDSAKGDIDYSVFKKNYWTPEEIKQIKFYTKRDVELTKKLYEWLENYFVSFKDFISDSDINGKYYLTDTIPKFAYKSICFALDWEPDYNKGNIEIDEDEKIAGGYVAYPAGEKFEGLLYQMDFSSLYPHIMIQCNLFGRVNEHDSNKYWHGGGKWDVKGYYDKEKLHPISQLLKTLYYLRLFYKRKSFLVDGTPFKFSEASNHIGKKFFNIHKDNNKKMELFHDDITEQKAKYLEKLAKQGKDPKEYTVKILINIFYGILNNNYYKLVADNVAGGDCTRIGRQWVKYARKRFRDEGYKILYTDTDSWYFEDVYNDKQRFIDLKNKVIQEIKETLPFPQFTFDSDIDSEMKYMYFFKGENSRENDEEMDEDDIKNKSKGYMKKNYIYVTNDDKVVIKNLGIKKKSISGISKKIFWDYIVPFLKQGKHKFSKTEIENKMIEYLQEDISLAYMRKNVKDISAYNNSKTGIQYQIAEKYGEGIHFLVPNIRDKGVGKKIKYCSKEEFEKYDMYVGDVDFTNFWKELNYFIKEKKQLNLFNVIGQ